MKLEPRCWLVFLAITLASVGCDDECTLASGVYTGTFVYESGTCPSEMTRDWMEGTTIDFTLHEDSPCENATFDSEYVDGSSGCDITRNGTVAYTADGIIGSMTVAVDCNDGLTCTDFYNILP